MDQNPRCENCGRKRPCAPCEARQASELADLTLDALYERAAERETPGVIMLHFNMPLDLARQHLNRVCQEWIWPVETLEPESGEWLTAVLACSDESGGPIITSYTVTETRISEDTEFWAALGRAFEQF